MVNYCNLSPAQRTLVSWEMRGDTHNAVNKLTTKQALQLNTFSITSYFLCEQIDWLCKCL